MRQHQTILRDLDDYCLKAGLRASTVCRNATGNPRLRERLEAKLASVDRDVSALRKYMEDHPAEGNAVIEQRGAA